MVLLQLLLFTVDRLPLLAQLNFSYKLAKSCLRVCVHLCVDIRLDVNQGGTNHNHYTQRLVVLRAQTY